MNVGEREKQQQPTTEASYTDWLTGGGGGGGGREGTLSTDEYVKWCGKWIVCRSQGKLEEEEEEKEAAAEKSSPAATST